MSPCLAATMNYCSQFLGIHEVVKTRLATINSNLVNIPKNRKSERKPIRVLIKIAKIGTKLNKKQHGKTTSSLLSEFSEILTICFFFFSAGAALASSQFP